MPIPGSAFQGPRFYMHIKQDYTGIGLVGMNRMGVLTNQLVVA